MYRIGWKALRPNMRLTLIFLAVVAISGPMAGESYGQKKPVLDVPYCEVVNHPEKYGGKLVRFESIFYSIIPDSSGLYDPACDDNGLLPLFDCDDGKNCRSWEKERHKKTVLKGDQSRVILRVVGVVQLPSSEDRYFRDRTKILIKRIEAIKPVPKSLQW